MDRDPHLQLGQSTRDDGLVRTLRHKTSWVSGRHTWDYGAEQVPASCRAVCVAGFPGLSLQLFSARLMEYVFRAMPFLFGISYSIRLPRSTTQGSSVTGARRGGRDFAQSQVDELGKVFARHFGEGAGIAVQENVNGVLLDLPSPAQCHMQLPHRSSKLGPRVHRCCILFSLLRPSICHSNCSGGFFV